MGDWSSGMIPALGAGGREFDSRITPFAINLIGLHNTWHEEDKCTGEKVRRKKKKKSPMRGSNPRLAG